MGGCLSKTYGAFLSFRFTTNRRIGATANGIGSRSGIMGTCLDAEKLRGMSINAATGLTKRFLRTMQDPIIKQRVIKLVVDISSKALDKTPSFALKVLEHILMTHLEDRPEYPAYSESVKELHNLASHELRRLAMRYADYFSVSVIDTSF